MNSEREMYISVPYLAVARSEKSAEALEFSGSGKRKACAEIWSKNSLNRVEQSADTTRHYTNRINSEGWRERPGRSGDPLTALK